MRELPSERALKAWNACAALTVAEGGPVTRHSVAARIQHSYGYSYPEAMEAIRDAVRLGYVAEPEVGVLALPDRRAGRAR